jgi:hypothetical protein
MTVQEAYAIAKQATEKEGEVDSCFDLGDVYAFHFEPILVGDWSDTVDKTTGKTDTLAGIPDNLERFERGKEISLKKLKK